MAADAVAPEVHATTALAEHMEQYIANAAKFEVITSTYEPQPEIGYAQCPSRHFASLTEALGYLRILAADPATTLLSFNLLDFGVWRLEPRCLTQSAFNSWGHPCDVKRKREQPLPQVRDRVPCHVRAVYGRGPEGTHETEQTFDVYEEALARFSVLSRDAAVSGIFFYIESPLVGEEDRRFCRGSIRK